MRWCVRFPRAKNRPGPPGLRAFMLRLSCLLWRYGTHLTHWHYCLALGSLFCLVLGLPIFPSDLLACDDSRSQGCPFGPLAGWGSTLATGWRLLSVRPLWCLGLSLQARRICWEWWEGRQRCLEPYCPPLLSWKPKTGTRCPKARKKKPSRRKVRLS